ncbi:MAG TPA: hypothetical protein VGF16_15855 [Bryobacteraceae bacterium]|jgi:hypothetical protein
MGCGSCQTAPRPQAPAPLFQIRRGYRTRWNDLAFSVESDSGDWTLCVQDPARRETLYTAHRGGARAAQVAAAEYAIFRVLGPESRISPDRLAKELTWQEYW